MTLHSKYNPQAEAQRFIETFSGDPDYIIITEPGESYLAGACRKKFPRAQLIAIRYTNTLFLDSDALWDYVYRPAHANLSFFLLNIIPDELFSKTLILSWKPSDRYWPNAAKFISTEIQKTIELFKSIMITRTAFSKRWLKNIAVNFLTGNHFATLNFPVCSYAFAAAGFSLETSAHALTQCKIPLLCAGSGYDALAFRSLPVSACITTDGGFWAARHIARLSSSVPLLFTAESAVPKTVLEKNPLVMLSYNSAVETELAKRLSIPTVPAKRNGTVSGTAVELLLQQKAQNIYCFGLDLTNGTGFSHCRPHSSLNSMQRTTMRLTNLETCLAAGRCTGSLNIYSDWFLHLEQSKAAHIKRVGNKSLMAAIASMQVISPEAFSNEIKKDTASSLEYEIQNTPNSREKQELISAFFKRYADIIQSSSLDRLHIKSTGDAQVCRELIELAAYSAWCIYLKNKSSEEEAKVKSTVIEALTEVSTITAV